MFFTSTTIYLDNILTLSHDFNDHDQSFNYITITYRYTFWDFFFLVLSHFPLFFSVYDTAPYYADFYVCTISIQYHIVLYHIV